MMNRKIQVDSDEIEDEYNFSKGVRGKYFEAYKQSQIIVISQDTGEINCNLLNSNSMEKSEPKCQNLDSVG
jgi:hypothetical protein